MSITTLANLEAVAAHLRKTLDDKKYVVLYAYNGTGKTRLSMAFKEAGKNGDARDTLYFNAFTEDLFTWDNDLENDSTRELRFNTHSRFFNGIDDLEMDTRIRRLLCRYADFDFKILKKTVTTIINQEEIKQEITYVSFERESVIDGQAKTVENIKVSRGEENIFIWCFFLVIAQLAIDQEEGSPYAWVKYLYIDDPISSLDDNNAIAVASHLAQLLSKKENKIKVVLSSHHTLFFNVMWNELGQTKKAQPYFLSKEESTGLYSLRYTGATPFFHHVALLKQMKEAADSGELYTYHFNMLRGILEKAASFHGFKNFSACIKQGHEDPDGILHARMINVLSHGDYSLFEPMQMLDENKQYFKTILDDFMANYRFNPELFPEPDLSTSQP
ncbi:AAA family ATPase [Massilia sp. PWRC2]|uniref:AAA family ATPase n=1 Tax=Massilia sp. PWRC2 TaxID=2804626 RepID=UPI003CF7C7E6